MPRLRIYSAGTGRLQFDSSGSASDVTEESIKRDFKSDLLLYYDPNRNGLRCYVKLVRSGSEQFLADYEYDDGDATPLESFKAMLEREVDEVGWRVEGDAGYEQQLYESIGVVSEASPDVSADDIDYLLRTEGQLRFGTPNEAQAIGLVSYLRRAFDDRLDVAVTYSGETGTHSDVDVVIVPGATDAVTVTSDQRAVLARRRLSELESAASSTGVGGAASAMQRALASAGGEDRLGVAISARDASMPGVAAGRRNAVLTTLLLVPLALLAVVFRTGSERLLPALTRQQGFYLPFGEALDQQLPFGVPQFLFDFTSWHVVLLSTVLVGTALVITPPVQRTLTALTGVSIPGLGETGQSGPTPADRADAAVDELVELQRIASGDARQRLDGVLNEFGLETGSKSARKRTELAVKAGGVVGGIVIAVSTFFVASLGARVVFSILVDRWTLVLNLFVAGAVVATVGTVTAASAVLAMDLFSGPTSNRGRSGSRSGSSIQAVSGPAGQSTRGPSFDIDSFEKQVKRNPQQAVGRTGAAMEELRRHKGSATPQTKRLARAILELTSRVQDSLFRLSANDRKLVKQHAGKTNVDEILGGSSTADRQSTSNSRTRSQSQPTADSRNRGGENADVSSGGGGTNTPSQGSSPQPDGSNDEPADDHDEGTTPNGDDPDDYLFQRPEDDEESTESATSGTGELDRIDTGVDKSLDAGNDDESDSDPFRSRRTVSAEGASATANADSRTGTDDRSDAADDLKATQKDSGGQGPGDVGSATATSRAVGTSARFPQFRYDAANTGVVDTAASSVLTPTTVWEPVELAEECTTTPLVWGEHLIVATRVGHVHGISLHEGERTVIATLGSPLVATPAIVDDTLVVVTTDGDVVGYALTADGQLTAEPSWRNDGAVGGARHATVSPTVEGSRVFITGSDGRVHALDCNGAAVWDTPYPTGSKVMLSSPAVADGDVYVATTAGTLHAIDADTGVGQWTTSLGDEWVLATPAVDDDRLLVGDQAGTFYAVDITAGAVVETTSVGDEVISSAAVRDGTAYVVSNVGGQVMNRDDDSQPTDEPAARAVARAVDVADGLREQWRQPLDAMTVSSPTVTGEGVVIGTNSGWLTALDRADGDPLWPDDVSLGSPIEASVAAVDGAVYVPAHDGTVCGFAEDER